MALEIGETYHALFLPIVITSHHILSHPITSYHILSHPITCFCPGHMAETLEKIEDLDRDMGELRSSQIQRLGGTASDI